MKKQLFILFYILSIFSILNAENKTEDSVTMYRNAIFYFDQNDYGKALTYAEDAITYKKNESDTKYNILTDSLSSKQVKSAGDSIYNILKVLEKRSEKKSIKIIQDLIKIKGEEFFEDSMQKMLLFIQSESEYPEAQYLIGKIFQIEGEYSVAETYYNLALANKAVLDIPDYKYEILYNLAEISKMQKDYDKYETRLLNILIDDKFANDETLKKALANIIQSNKKNSCERFFMLFRAGEYKSIKAYNLLSDFYYDNGYVEKALVYNSLSVITSFTKIYDILTVRNTNYEYSNLKSFFEEVNSNQDIIEWGNNNDVWKSFNALAKLTTELDYTIFAKELLTVLVRYSPQEYWQKEAVLQLERLK